MLTDTEKSALERAAKLCEFHAIEWGVASGQNTVADAATLRGLIERAGWQPMETAPRDGTPVLIWKPDERMVGEYTMAAYWSDNHLGKSGWVPVAGLHVQGYHSSVTDTPQGYPTRWQPLPTPPTE